MTSDEIGASDPCVRCGEPTASGPLYSDRAVPVGPKSQRAFICGLCRSEQRANHRRGRPQLSGNLEYVIPSHVSFTH